MKKSWVLAAAISTLVVVSDVALACCECIPPIIFFP